MPLKCKGKGRKFAAWRYVAPDDATSNINDINERQHYKVRVGIPSEVYINYYVSGGVRAGGVSRDDEDVSCDAWLWW